MAVLRIMHGTVEELLVIKYLKR